MKKPPVVLASLTLVEIKTENAKVTTIRFWIMFKLWSKTRYDVFFDLFKSKLWTYNLLHICWILGQRIQFYSNFLLSVNVNQYKIYCFDLAQALLCTKDKE